MEIKTKDIEIPSSDPFQNDLLDRKTEIENLSPILCEIEGPLVFAINSPWGTGKTTFINLWQKHLQTINVNSIYFNAWENDFAEDPLIAIVSGIDKWITLDEKYSSSINAWKKAKLLLPGIVKSSAIAATKIATFGGLDLNKEYEKVAAELAGGVAENLIDSFNNKSAAINEFRKLIGEMLSTLGEDQKNILVFIDELDRCRPTYAIELLERIKHLFNIDSLVFILATDIEQLSHSVCAVYGEKFNSRKYLQRFVDIDYSLKEPDKHSYIVSLFDSLNLNKYFLKRKNSRHDKINLLDCFSIMTIRFNLSLREINLFLTRIRLILLSVPVNYYLDEPLIIGLIMLREYNPKLYSAYASDPGVADEVIEYLGDTLPSSLKYEKPFCSLSGFLIAPNAGVDGSSRLTELLEPYNNISSESSANTDRLNAANLVIRIANHTRDFGETIEHKISIERIELLQRINIEL